MAWHMLPNFPSLFVCHQNLAVGDFEEHSTELKSGVIQSYHLHLSNSLNLPLDLIRYPTNVLVLFPYVSAKMALADVGDFEQHTLPPSSVALTRFNLFKLFSCDDMKIFS